MTWENNLEPDQPQITRRMRFACWIQETTNIHSEYETSFFTANSGCKNVPQCYTTLPTLSKLYFWSPARMQNLWWWPHDLVFPKPMVMAAWSCSSKIYGDGRIILYFQNLWWWPHDLVLPKSMVMAALSCTSKIYGDGRIILYFQNLWWWPHDLVLPKSMVMTAWSCTSKIYGDGRMILYFHNLWWWPHDLVVPK